MKRVVALLFVILLISAIVVSAMASTEYVFEKLNIALLPDFGIYGDDGSGSLFYLDSVLSAGSYDVWICDPVSGEDVFLGCLAVSFAPYEDQDHVLFSSHDVSLSAYPNVLFKLMVLVDLDYGESQAALLGFTGDSSGGGFPLTFERATQLRFVPIDDHLIGAFDSVDLGNCLSGVLVLLPVCLVILVSFIALRKGISFVRGLISGV